MVLFSHKIHRYELERGDHIYSWRIGFAYSHHGIYVSEREVIHFTGRPDSDTGSGGRTIGSFSSISSSSLGKEPCLVCGFQPSTLVGVKINSSCLDCFLGRGGLRRYEYGVSRASFMLSIRGGTCTTAPSDPSDEVVYRARYLLSENGFGAYNVLTNNCEDFALYCKTGLVVSSKKGSSGQAHSGYAASDGIKKIFSSVGSVAFAVVCPPGAYAMYCHDRLMSDIGVREDVTKVSVERLVQLRAGSSNNASAAANAAVPAADAAVPAADATVPAAVPATAFAANTASPAEQQVYVAI